MADAKITQLPELTDIADADLFVVVSSVATTPVTKKILKSNVVPITNALYKASSAIFTDDNTSQTFTDAFVSTTAMVAIQVTGGTAAAGTWTVFGTSGSFRIDSTVGETTNIPFNYFIIKN